MYYKQKYSVNRVSNDNPVGISQPPVNILFTPLDVSKTIAKTDAVAEKFCDNDKCVADSFFC